MLAFLADESSEDVTTVPASSGSQTLSQHTEAEKPWILLYQLPALPIHILNMIEEDDVTRSARCLIMQILFNSMTAHTLKVFFVFASMHLR